MEKGRNKIFCIISHTHWDREWYMPLENFRHRLTDLMDRLLAALEEQPDYIFHLDEKTYAGLWAFARKVAVALKAAVPCKRVGVAVLGMEVPHTHIHLVPLQSEGDLVFRKEHLKLNPEQFRKIADSILKEYEKL